MRIEKGAVATRVVLKGRQGECYQWKGNGQCSRGDKCSFQHDENKRSKSTPKSALSFGTTNTKRWKCVEEKEPRELESIWEVSSTTATTVSARVHLVIIGVLPNANSSQKESRRKFGNKCSFMHRQVEGQPNKKPKKGGDKSAVGYIERCATVGLRIS